MTDSLSQLSGLSFLPQRGEPPNQKQPQFFFFIAIHNYMFIYIYIVSLIHKVNTMRASTVSLFTVL